MVCVVFLLTQVNAKPAPQFGEWVYISQHNWPYVYGSEMGWAKAIPDNYGIDFYSFQHGWNQLSFKRTVTAITPSSKMDQIPVQIIALNDNYIESTSFTYKYANNLGPEFSIVIDESGLNLSPNGIFIHEQTYTQWEFHDVYEIYNGDDIDTVLVLDEQFKPNGDVRNAVEGDGIWMDGEPLLHLTFFRIQGTILYGNQSTINGIHVDGVYTKLDHREGKFEVYSKDDEYILTLNVLFDKDFYYGTFEDVMTGEITHHSGKCKIIKD